MNIFFTGCTHFGHANILRLANRPFSSVDEMDWELIERWNKRVAKDDTVYHLGDFGWLNSEQVGRLLPQLNGRKILIHGNHDGAAYINSRNWWYQAPYHEIEHNKTKLVLFHYPIEDWNGRWKGSIHLHCHTHAKEFRNPSLPNPANSALDLGNLMPPNIVCNRFNVGVDATSFAPVSLEEIMLAAHP